MKNLKVWIEIDKSAIVKNIRTMRRILKTKTKLWSVVKSNAYGHGLTAFSRTADDIGVDGFCVDSVIEGMKLRQSGIKKPVLVLGPSSMGKTDRLMDAAAHGIAVTISNFGALSQIMKQKKPPQFHLKIDTGMHRQGFYFNELPKVIKLIKGWNPKTENFPLKGIYTHFAAAKDLNYPTFTDFQFHQLKKSVRKLEAAGFKNLITHAAATGGALISPEYHLDAVRVGIGLYGLWPSRELEHQLGGKIHFTPVLSWHSYVSEVKQIAPGSYIGYDLVERAYRKSQMAIVPIGYWHGFDRGLSGIGEILIRGRRARVLGRVSMDLIAVDATGIPVKVGDRATLIGGQGKDMITATEMGSKIGTTHYEIVTRINPLIERIVV